MDDPLLSSIFIVVAVSCLTISQSVSQSVSELYKLAGRVCAGSGSRRRSGQKSTGSLHCIIIDYKKSINIQLCACCCCLMCDGEII